MTASPLHNITTLLDEAAARTPDRKALVFGNESLTFGDLLVKVNQCGRRLRDRGLRPGERVIIMIPMSPLLYVVLLAIMRCGAVAVFVDPWIPMRQIAAFSAFAEPAGFVGIPKSHLLRLFNRRLARLKITASSGKVFMGLPARFSLDPLEEVPADMAPAAVHPDDPALITFTSGSSGIPKGANRTHGFLRAQYMALCEELDYRDTDIDMPMFPVFALRNLAGGITSVIPKMDFRRVAEVDPAILCLQIRENGVTLVTASPPFIDRLATLDQPPRLRLIFTGGAPVTAAQIKRWHAAFPDTRIEIIYGSTEAEPVAHLSSGERLETDGEIGFCCGRPTTRLNIRIVQIRQGRITAEELDALTLPQGETGELLVAGDHVCRDYFNNPEAVLNNKIIDANGLCWHRMGDTGYMDATGRFFLTGRLHSTIVRNGRILHAQLVEEEVAKRMPSAVRVAALEREGRLVVVVQGADANDAAKPIDADRIIFTDKPLPLDPRHNSKIDYEALKQWINKGKLK